MTSGIVKVEHAIPQQQQQQQQQAGPPTGQSQQQQQQAPRFTTHPSSSGSIVSEGRTKILQCHALGSPQPTYRWLKDGIPVADYSSSQFYRIHNTKREDAGSYQCIARNEAGSIFSEKSEVVVSSGDLLFGHTSHEADELRDNVDDDDDDDDDDGDDDSCCMGAAQDGAELKRLEHLINCRRALKLN
ncbi:protein sidekick-like [Drosophila mojavensis]|uniref:protein sidekick-like n=1 Tax=Drosophila mojavensis TaxID=7230 RepID=UPI0013EEC3E4|nr:protein sidekick-like [Drosophila mojavensis]